MNNVASKKIQMQCIIMTCYLFGTTFSASLFGIDFSGPNKVTNSGLGQISQVVNPSRHQYSDPRLDNNHFSSDGNTNERPHGYSFPMPGRIIEEFMVKTQESPEINTSKDTNRIDTCNSEKVPSLDPIENDHDTSVSELESDDSTLGSSETGTDYNTETTEYETTTSEPLNRIGGAPPAVVASLLG